LTVTITISDLKVPLTGSEEIIYPDSDGERVADNTQQFEWISVLKWELEALLADNPDVFVAGGLLWYPVQGSPRIRVAPDVLVAFDRPKGYRGSYKQWVEGDVAPQVVFEILSPGNTTAEMLAKQDFYDRYGVEEFYLYDPDGLSFLAWQSVDGNLRLISRGETVVSPRLGVRFEKPEGEGLQVFRPDGTRFRSPLEVQQELARTQEALTQAEASRDEERLRREAVESALADANAERERLLAQVRALGGNLPDELG